MSPIVGLTDRSPSFIEIGRLRLGIPKSEALINGPKEISYFRADWRPSSEYSPGSGNAAALFLAAYGEKPTSINFRLPFPEINRCWDAFYEIYNKMGMLGMSNGVKWLYLRHNRTGELLVKDGVPVHADGTKVDENTGEVYLPFDKSVPVYTYTSKKGAEVKVYARPTGRLRIVIPELKRAAFVQIITNSLYNVIHLSEQLAGVEEVAKSAGMKITQVPMVITRRKESISVSFDGHKQIQERYLLNIEIDPIWMEAQFNYLNAQLPGGPAPVVPLALNAGPITQREFTPEEVDEATDESGEPPMPEEPADDEPTQAEVVDLKQETRSTGTLNNGQPRPYAPETLKVKLQAKAINYTGAKATQKQINLAAMVLKEIFAGPDAELARHALQMYLFGKPSLSDVEGALILVMLNDWLKPVKDSGGAFHADGMATREALAAYQEAIKVQGQLVLPLEEAKPEIPF